MQVDRASSFSDLTAADLSLLEMASRGSFYAHPRWFENFERYGLDDDAQLCLFTARDNGTEARPSALLALRTPAGQPGSVFRGRKIRARSLASLTSFQSTLFSVPVIEENGGGAAALEAIARAIFRDRPMWSVVDIDMMDSSSPLYRSLVTAFRRAGWVTRPYQHTVTLFENTAGMSYDDYLASRPKIGLGRKTKAFEKQGQSRFELITGSDQLEKGIKTYESVFAASWKGPEKFDRYAAGLIAACADAGSLRLGVLYLDDVPTAVQFWIVAGRKATIYKTHYDQKFRRLSVGVILTARMMKHVIEVDGVEEVDFGRGDERHKRPWLSQQRQMGGFLAFNWRSPGGLIELARQLGIESSEYLVRLATPVLKPLRDALRRFRARLGARE